VSDAVADHPRVTPPDLLVLHSLRCIGFAELRRVAEATGLTDPDVESELIDLGAAGLVTYRTGAFEGWGLTDTGRTVDAERIVDELRSTGARTAIAEAYDVFLALNPELLELCTAWQTRFVDGTMIMNDHSDSAYDAQVLDRLTDLDQRAEVALAALSAAMLRFRRYRTRLTNALTRAKAGALESVADGIASYHTVWFQLHEDLLVTLGTPRH
jgi:hypothetical protein